MTPELYRLAGALFDRLRDLPDKDLRPTLDAACAGNAELRAQVMRLIEADRNAGSGGFLEGRAVEDAALLLTRETPVLPAAGTVIGNYRLVAQIGVSGMGVVYEGQDLRLDRRVAVKILPLTFAAEAAERIRRFQREARAASTLNHPDIVSIFDADFDQGHHYIAMEFVEGKTLRQLAGAQTPPLDSQTILDWGGPTASSKYWTSDWPSYARLRAARRAHRTCERAPAISRAPFSIFLRNRSRESRRVRAATFSAWVWWPMNWPPVCVPSMGPRMARFSMPSCTTTPRRRLPCGHRSARNSTA